MTAKLAEPISSVGSRAGFERAQEPSANCAFSGGCGEAGASARGLPADLLALAKDHPCYSEDAHHHFARLHLAVAPGCNL